MNPAPPLGVYIHWPYCTRICPYCDFNVLRDRRAAQEKADLAEAIRTDLRVQARLIGPRSLVSIYFGGGTPSLMDPEVAATMVGEAKALWDPHPDLEVTLEANPTDVEAGRFADFAKAGMTRISLGVQSLRDTALKMLGRNHDAATARRAVETAMAAFTRVSLDLIYALPGQSAADWAGELAEIVALGPEHISPYQLTIEAGTAFERAARRGLLEPPGPETAADLFETTQEMLADAGFDAYEVSNHSRGAAARSRHNLGYWRGDDYAGVGPGAHGRLTMAGSRWECVAARGVADYIAQVARGAPPARRLTAHETAMERLFMGLRTTEGVAMAELAVLEIEPSKVDSLAAVGLAELGGGRLVVTPQGRLVLNRIVLELAGGS